MKKIFITLFVTIVSLVGVNAQSLTPSQILAKAVALISNAKGVEAKFSVSGQGYVGGGEIKTLGTKFKVTLPDVSVWYNGSNLYTYNKNAGETTLIIPTPEELAETNPLAYITGAQKNYSVSFSTVKKSGKYVLELLPTSKSNSIKRITLTLNKTSFAPEKIVMEPKTGAPLTAEINYFKTGINVSTSEFVYPKASYPNVEVIDLR